MGPAIHGDGGDVTCGIEAAGAERARHLIADVALHGFEIRCEQFHAAHAVLLARGKAGVAGGLHQVHDDRLFRLVCALVAAHAHRQIEVHIRVVHAGGVNRIRAKFVE